MIFASRRPEFRSSPVLALTLLPLSETSPPCKPFFFWIDSVNNVLWSYLLVALLLGCAVWFTVRTRGVQFRMLREMLRVGGVGGRRTAGRAACLVVSGFRRLAGEPRRYGQSRGRRHGDRRRRSGSRLWMWIIALLGLRAPSSNRPSPSSTNVAAGIPISAVRPIIWNGDWAGAGWAWSLPY